MDLMDLLLADALSAGMARQMAREAQRPPPDNFFILPPEPEAWRKLRAACKEEHMVVCIEITDDSHPPSKRIQPLIVDLAREVSQIPFFRVKIGTGSSSHDQLREDLHGVRFSPTVIIALFDDDDIIIKRAEGEDEIKVALRIGAFEQIIKEFIDKRMKLKLAERLAEEFAGAVASDIARKKASLEYEQKLKKEKEDIEKKEKERQEQNQKALENERIKRIDAEKKAEEARQKEQKAKLKAYVIDDLLSMDLKKAKVAEIKEKMADLGISSAGCFTRDALISVLKDNIPVLKTKLQQENPSQSYSGSTTPSSYISSNRHLLFDEQVDSSHSDNKLSADKANARIKSLEENIDDLDQKRVSLEEKNSQLEKQLKINNALLEKKDQEIMDLKQKSVSFLRRSQDHPDTQGKIKELENELIETRLLYACTVDDLDILGLIAKNQEGAVVRAKCIKDGLPNSSRVYAVKILIGVLETSTLSRVRCKYKNEYEILSCLSPHKNIVHLYAFFYDRPKSHPKLRDCGPGMALFLLMEHLSQNMKNYLDVLRNGAGPGATKVVNWFRDVLSGLNYLYSKHIVHRDLKLDNLALLADNIKIVDFGSAIKLDHTMKLPFAIMQERGGNEAHLAPEILNERSGPGRVLNYTKQPVWAAGVLAYELAGHTNPFSSNIDQRGYDVSSLPCLSSTYCQGSVNVQTLPRSMTTLVESMLEFDSSKRPTLNEALQRVSNFL